ncbi:glycoside hydrolase family 5 protein [Stutzerimonas chloritidismutans]
MSLTHFAHGWKHLAPAAALITLLGALPLGVTAQAATTPASVSSIAYTAQIKKLTNKQWNNGSWRASAGVSLAATPANLKAFKAGTRVRLADGQIRTIKSAKSSGGVLTVLMTGTVINGARLGYPNAISAVPASTNTATATTTAKSSVTNPTSTATQSAAAVTTKTAAPAVAPAPKTTTVSTSTTAKANTLTSTAKTTTAATALAPQATATTPVQLVGVSLSGAAFGSSALPGKHGTNYIYPAESYYKKYAEQGLKLVRLPFLWERIQPTLDTELDAAQLALLTQSLDFAQKHGVKVVLDMHNYYRYYKQAIGSANVPVQSFANTWKRIAQKVGKHPALSGYGLMNEPNTNGLWPATALAAAKAIRQVDKVNWIYVAGDRYSSAWHWPQSNTQLISDPWMRDANNKLIFEAHMYLDRDTSGMYADKTETFAPDLGIKRAKPFVDWLRANKLRGYIGEIGVPNYAPDAILAMDNLLGYLRENCVPMTYWAAGPWWGSYILSLDVTGGAPQPQLPVLVKHAKAPNSCAAIGQPL